MAKRRATTRASKCWSSPKRKRGKAVRVQIEEVLYVDPRWRVELVRASLPDSIAPLRLSVHDPAALAGRDAALIGHPGADARSDAGLMHQLFAETLEIKRMMPGRVIGPGDRPGDQEGVVLVHDCTSTGGCDGAPIVDAATGEVLGLQFAGQYLTANYAVPSYELARDVRFAEAGVGFAGALPPSAAPVPAVQSGADVGPEQVVPALPVDSGTTSGDEAPASRQSLLAESWRSDVDDDWRPLLAAREQRLELSMRAVGKLLTGSGDAGWNGTAFLVGDRLAMTASFVALEFSDGAGANARIKEGRKPALDFRDALRSRAEAIAAVSGVRFIHPYFQVALLELETMPEGVAVLDLSAQVPSQLSGRLVAVIAITERDGATPLLLQPGKALQLGRLPGDLPLPALVHDCETGTGSAGAPVLDLGTGSVMGIHTHAGRQTRGFAQPSWELARDPYVWEHGIRFRPDPKPPWLESWEVPEARPAKPLPSAQEPEIERWTVFDIPIDWEREEPRRMEELLVKAIDVRTALIMAENVGFDRTTVDANSPPLYLWRDLLTRISVAGRLGPLLEAIAREPQHAGIAAQLRTYL